MKDHSEKFTDTHRCAVCRHEFEVTEELGSYRCPNPACPTFKYPVYQGIKPLDLALKRINVKKIMEDAAKMSLEAKRELDGIREWLKKNGGSDPERND